MGVEVPECARSVGHLYVAYGLEPVATKREEGEATMKLEYHTEKQLRYMVEKGEICSVTVIAALYHFREYLNRSRGESSWFSKSGKACLVVVAASALIFS